MQGCTDSARVSSQARPVDSHTTATAENGEAGSFELSKRSGAAARLSYDDVLMTAPNDASFPPGLDGVTAPPGGESVALQDAPAQILPEAAPGDVISDKVDEGAEIEMDVSEWTMDEWLADHRGFEDPEKIVDLRSMTYTSGAHVRDATLLLMTYGDEIRLPEGPNGRLVTGPGLGARVALARRRMRWCGPRASLLRLTRWEIAEGRAESSNHRWAVEALVDVRRPEVRRGRQLVVRVRWAGTNPLFDTPWTDSEVLVRDLTGDLRAQARDMERVKYPDGVTERPAPLRVLGKRRQGDGRDVFLGSRWNGGDGSANGWRARFAAPALSSPYFVVSA